MKASIIFGCSKKNVVRLLVVLFLQSAFCLTSAKAALSFVMVPYGTVPHANWLYGNQIPDSIWQQYDAPIPQATYYDPVYHTVYLVEDFPGDSFTFWYWETIEYMAPYTLTVNSPIPFQYWVYPGWYLEPDFSDSPAHYPDAFDINSQISESLFQGDWAQLDQGYRELTHLRIEHSLNIGHAVRLYNDDGSSTLIFPNGYKDILSASVDSNIEVFLAQDGSYQVGVAGTVPPEGSGILGNTTVIGFKVPSTGDQIFDTVNQSLASVGQALSSENNSLFDLWLDRSMQLGSYGEVSSPEAYIGPGALRFFDGWVSWDDGSGVWSLAELNEAFLAEAPYQTPVFGMGYRAGVLINSYMYDEYEDIATDPVTGYEFSRTELITDIGLEAATLVISYKMIPAPYSTGSYTDRVLQTELRVLSPRTGSLVDPTVVAELQASGTNLTPQNVVATGKNAAGQIVFLEKGNSASGLQHIIEEHGTQFANIGVSQRAIPSVVTQAVTQGRFVGYQGIGPTARPIYEITINGQTQRIAVTVADNGYIVGANPAGSP